MFLGKAFHNFCGLFNEAFDIETVQSVLGGKVSTLGGHSIGHSKQRMCIYTCPILNGLRDRAISLYKIVDKKKIFEPPSVVTHTA
jgi:hypothetical protein